MTTPTPKPWYKQFWPWFLITIPALSMVLSITMLNLAINTEDSLVVDDYYKQGKAINLQKAKIQEARVRNIAVELDVLDNSVTIRFVSGQPDTGEALKLDFFHPTLDTRDHTILLASDASGNFRGQAEAPLNGKWHITLSPLSELWKVSDTIILPDTQTFTLIP